MFAELGGGVGHAETSGFDAEIALRAITHPGRRLALELVTQRERTATELAEACGWSRPAASQHLRVLRQAGLVADRRSGTRRLYQPRADNMIRLRTFLDEFWSRRLRLLAAELEPEAMPGQGSSRP